MKSIVINCSTYPYKTRRVLLKGIQEHAFELGYHWVGNSNAIINTDCTYLYLHSGGLITDSWYTTDKPEEFTVEKFFELGKNDVVDALPIVKIGRYYTCPATNELVICTEVDANVDTIIDNRYFVGVSVSGVSSGADIYCNKNSFIETEVHIMVDI